MDVQSVDFQHEMKVEIDQASLLNYENTGGNPGEINRKQIKGEYFVPKTIKQEQINIKSEEEGDQFSTDEVNEKQIQEDYFESKSIKQEDIEIKSENEEMDEFSTESSAGDNERGLHPTNKAAHLSDFFRISEEPPSFKCLKCSYQTHKERYIKRHVHGHMPQKTFQCPLCPFKSKYKYYLKEHQLVHVQKEEVALHKCPECLFTSKRKPALIRHLLVHKKPDDVAWYHCSECPFKTKYKFVLKQHILMSRNELAMNKCTLCPYESSSKRNLKRHLNSMHKPKVVPLISCPEEGCAFKTHDKSSLLRHVKYVHNYEKFLKCSSCPFATKYKANLKKHELKHVSPDKWFSCSQCPYKTPKEFLLNRHALIHMTDSEIVSLQCSDYSCNTNRDLKEKHSLDTDESGGWFHCYVCMWRTAYKRNLADHIRKKHRDADGSLLLGDL